MKILIAEDDLVACRILQSMLVDEGLEVIAVSDGEEAWEQLKGPAAAKLAILDWMMPGLDGPEVCRKVRAVETPVPPYLMLLTSREAQEDIVTGLRSGANDYLTKPFHREELQARLRVGRTVVELQSKLVERVRDLEAALAEVKRLRRLLPICCYCKKIRDDQNYWQQVDHYLAQHSNLQFTHGICPACWQKEVEPELKAQGIE